MSEQVQADDKQTLVTCPVCQAEKIINIPGYIFLQKQGGVIKIQIHDESLCEHNFVVFVDRNGIARGYEQFDFQLQFTARTEEDYAAPDQLYLADLLQTFGEFATLSIFHAFLLDYKIYVIIDPTDNPLFVDQLNKLMISFFPRDVSIEPFIEAINRKDFLQLEEAGFENLILDIHGRIINAPWGEKKKFDFENCAIKKALEIIDDNSQGFLIQQEVNNLHENVEKVIHFLHITKKIYMEEFKPFLSKIIKQKVSNDFLDFCMLYIKRRMPEHADLLQKIHVKTLDNLKEGLW